MNHLSTDYYIHYVGNPHEVNGDEADKFEWEVQKVMSSMDASDTALAIYENNPVNDGCLEILAMVLKGDIDTNRLTVLVEHAKRMYAEAAVEARNV